MKWIQNILLLGLCAWVFAVQAAPFQVTDDRGITQSFQEAPKRIVSLLPSLTETVCALGHCEKLVAVDRYSNWPESLKKLPQVGGGMDPTIEAIVALRPDVVLMATSSRAHERLQALGLRVLALEPKTHADVQRVIGKIGLLLQEPDAIRLWRTIDAGVGAAAQSLPAAVRKQRVYFEVNNAPYAAGQASFMGETLSRLGAQNIVPADLGPFPKLNPEFIVRANPDIIMTGARDADAMKQRPGWGAMKALRMQAVCVFPTEQSEILVRPGPRMAEAARIMARCLQEKSR